MCNECRNENYRMGNLRFALIQGEERLEFTQTFCRSCAKLNFDITDLIMKNQRGGVVGLEDDVAKNGRKYGK